MGSLPGLHSQFPKLKDRLFEIITDEAGQIWDFDALLFLTDLPKMMRWSLFGDSKQLTPYVTKLVTKREYFSSIMTLFHPNSAEVVRLEVQYRMIPALCKAHAPVFYSEKEYKIRSHRPDPADPRNKGLFLEVLLRILLRILRILIPLLLRILLLRILLLRILLLLLILPRILLGYADSYTKGKGGLGTSALLLLRTLLLLLILLRILLLL